MQSNDEIAVAKSKSKKVLILTEPAWSSRYDFPELLYEELDTNILSEVGIIIYLMTTSDRDRVRSKLDKRLKQICSKNTKYYHISYHYSGNDLAEKLKKIKDFIKDKETLFLYPFFGRELFTLIDDKFNFTIYVMQWESEQEFKVKTIAVEDYFYFKILYMFFKDVEFPEYDVKKDILNLYLRYGPDGLLGQGYGGLYIPDLIHPANILMSSRDIYETTINRRCIIIGDYSAFVSWVIPRIKQNDNYFYHDLNEGLPEMIRNGFDGLILLNVHNLSLQKQSDLMLIIKSYDYNQKHIIFTSENLDCLIDEIKEFRFYFIKPIDEILENITQLYVSLYFRKKPFQMAESFSAQFVKENRLKPILAYVKNIRAFDSAVKKSLLCISDGVPRLTMDIGYWYYLYAEYKKSEKELFNKDSEKKVESKYLWLFRGDYWEISFGYEESILIKNLKGCYYLAYLFNNPNKYHRIQDLIKEVHKKNPEYRDRSTETVRSAIATVRNHIYDVERQLKLGHKLSKNLDDNIDYDTKENKNKKKESYIRISLTNKIKWKVSLPKIF